MAAAEENGASGAGGPQAPENPRPKKKSVYLLPNLLTTGTIFFGFYSVAAGLNGQFTHAALSILVAGIFDLLDGRVARALGAVSAFGKEYDSLADFLAFGMSPAIMVYQWALVPFGRVGWAAAFLFTVCGALRLARFNVAHYQQDSRVSKRYFQGLPIPAAAGSVALTVLFYSDVQIAFASESPADAWRWFPLMLVYVLAVLMVSSIRFRSFKDFSWHEQRPFMFMVAVVIMLTVLASNLEITLFLVAMAYLFSPLHSHPEYRKLLAEGEEIEEDEVEDLGV